jgi:hypothetical protein
MLRLSPNLSLRWTVGPVRPGAKVAAISRACVVAAPVEKTAAIRCQWC